MPVQYKSLKDKILKLLGFRKIPIYKGWTGKYLGYRWEFLGHLRD